VAKNDNATVALLLIGTVLVLVGASGHVPGFEIGGTKVTWYERRALDDLTEAAQDLSAGDEERAVERSLDAPRPSWVAGALVTVSPAR